MILFVYQLLFPLVGFAVLAKFIFGGRQKALREGWPELRQRLGRPTPDDLGGLAGGDVAWIHAASVGEVLAAEPLVRLLKSQKIHPKVLVSTSTVAGRARALLIPGIDAAVLLPADFYPAVITFLKRTNPYCLLLMEKEFWPILLWCALSRGIRIGIANGRLTERSTRRYGMLRPLFAPLLGRIERAAAQTEKDAGRFIHLGVPKDAVLATGNMKYDLPIPSETAQEEVRERIEKLGWGNDPIWVAGSTRPGEEEQVLAAHLDTLKKVPALKLILAPRHIERSEEVAALLRARGIRFIRWSQLLPSESDPGCLLIDTMGILGALYSSARVSFIGGTLVPVGGHNLLEPALQACPVLYGPHTSHTQAVATALQATGGGTVVENAEQLAESLRTFLDDADLRDRAGQKALKTAESFTGATRRTFEHIRPLLLPKDGR